MSTKLTFKKLFSLVLSLVIVLTSLSVSDFIHPINALAEEENERFLFVYFTGNDATHINSATSQELRFAVSNDGINFSPLNENKPVIVQNGGTKNVRDPYIFLGQDGWYYIIATDLNAGQDGTGFWGNQPQIVLWRSKDLLNWVDETYINAAQICGLSDEQVYRTWAPECIWDDSIGENGGYMIYFAFAAYGYNSTNMYYMTTTDLLDQSKYSMPQELYNPEGDSIDGDIVKQGDTYYMFYKDETPGRNTVCLATAKNVTGPYTYQGVFMTSRITGGIEGCEVYMIGNDYYLVADRYGAAGRFAIYKLGTDLSRLTGKEEINVSDGNPVTIVDDINGFENLSARHGSIIHISTAQYDALVDKWGKSDDDRYIDLPQNHSNKDIADSLVAEYFTQNDVTKDTSGNGNNLTMNGKVEWWRAEDHTDYWGSYGKDCAFFNDTDYMVSTDIYKNAGINSNDGFTISFYGFNFQDYNRETSRFFDLTTRQNLTWGSTDYNNCDYVFLGNSFKTGVKKQNTGDTTNSYEALYTREWHHYIVSVKGNHAYTYLDGRLVYQTSYADGFGDDWYNRMQDADLLIANSAWNGDQAFDGLMYQMRVFNKALTPTDVN